MEILGKGFCMTLPLLDVVVPELDQGVYVIAPLYSFPNLDQHFLHGRKGS